jgi:hypothetical protein
LAFLSGLLTFLSELTSPQECKKWLIRMGSLSHKTGERKKDPALWENQANQRRSLLFSYHYFSQR